MRDKLVSRLNSCGYKGGPLVDAMVMPDYSPAMGYRCTVA